MNTVIKSLFVGSTERELHKTSNMFWIEYTKFNHKNYTFVINEFIRNSKNIRDDNSHLWHQK